MQHNTDDGTIPDGGTVVRFEYDDSTTPTQGIVNGMAALEGVPATEIAPLYDRIRTEAMNELLEHAQSVDGYVGIEFTLEGYTVVVTSDERIAIYEEDPVTREPGTEP
ncbi:HalOD1 output domain-containing protein [Natrarchaeobius oligotrophus]|uniref:Halobacterial output domain-containing protein n=1 Tax=Natrarchaeobius chitinivorans TaxID=1679083 RepID=A0A3N6N5X4_NATCH|nr:HalOD1 output domain-containing protein [Natrarchaeobius chitinivorans]RQH03277.1 hypothetical protein EA472_01460 [Natrarchaeobius chitinivorans]